MRRRAVLAAGAAAAVGSIAAAGWTLWGKPRRRPRADPRFLTFGELARELASDPKVFDAVLEKIGAGRTAVGLVPAAERQVLRQLFDRASFDGLDHHPRVSLPSDGRGKPPELERVLASLPWATRDEVPFPDLRGVLGAAGWSRRT